ncbi:hypothetical protein HPB51_020893 [Rhipicephalus microplus]|uniref:Peptidase M13 N-terminal domain-containing protein n=1 Tax=Rhipicephalus microplus TaxID=6941 RepID=A0A9J6EPA8_RHIMP|nr:hypothetical protein HPB51_020893 [Rhipicephalus microplus]
MRTVRRCLPRDRAEGRDAVAACFPLVGAYLSRLSPALRRLAKPMAFANGDVNTNEVRSREAERKRLQWKTSEHRRDTVPSVAPRQVDDTEVSSTVKPPQPPPEFLGDLTELPCFCTALTLAATALTVALPMILRDQLPPCREPRCFEYAREMALSVDPGTDPCDDFFSHVCGNFEDLYPRYSSLLSVLGTRVTQYQDSVLNRLELSSSMETPGEVTVAAFRVCVEEYRSGYDGGLRAIRDLLWELGLYLRAKKVTYTVENVFEGMLRMSLSFDLPVLVRAVLVRSLKETAHNKLELQLDLHMPVAPVERTVDNIEYSLRAVAQNGTFSSAFETRLYVCAALAPEESARGPGKAGVPRMGSVFYEVFVEPRLLFWCQQWSLLNFSKLPTQLVSASNLFVLEELCKHQLLLSGGTPPR